MARQNTVFKEAYNRYVATLRTDEALPSEPEIASRLGISRSTARAILARLSDEGIIRWNKRQKIVLRDPSRDDFFPSEETDSLHDIIERSFMQRILSDDAAPGMQINELELAREIGTGTTSVREFLIRFSRFGLIEKRPNSHWILKGFTREFALELADVREMFELHSAAEFGRLPADNEAWEALARIKDDHRAMLVDFDNRYKEFSALDERFHLLIHGASRNRFIADFYDAIAIIFHYHYQWNKAFARERNERAIHEHLDYISALEARDPQAIERACRLHLRSARQTLLQSLPQSMSDAEARTA
ncbi:GntR family transcriptional regulator [Rhizobium grahamii]|uniref:GntR family transcriptional regulator n=1 Tax=Rhizobium grahamii TaxID=1120045 RepID=A0A5Q0CDS9_9HYPH|nr:MULTISPECIES: GntR family transcriptional regulator [Rhizobium]QFY62280.1 GntR family transcriptional regulator [Rhizobium grahamii]QRM48529.1 GntR family transcriptional regulator [Rhizobium sp. BG6]